MPWNGRHLTDEDLVLVLDGAMRPGRLRRAHRHLAECAGCRTRHGALVAACHDIARAARASAAEAVPHAVARARLTQVLDDGLADTPRPGTAHTANRMAALLALAATVTVAAAVFGPLVQERPPSVPGPASASGVTGPVRPDPRLTPGATSAVTVAEVCADSPHRPTSRVPASVPAQVFRAYGADVARADEYELDFLVTPELGGTTGAENLWPQPYTATRWNAFVKDELERLLLARVCAGTTPLLEAQQALAEDWVAAYQRYFATDHPLRDYTRAPLTGRDVAAWESEAEEWRLLPVELSARAAFGTFD